MKTKNIFILLVIILIALVVVIFFKNSSQQSAQIQSLATTSVQNISSSTNFAVQSAQVEKNIEPYVTECGVYALGELSFSGKILNVDIADDTCKQTLGLSGREALSDGQGMLFVFNTLGSYGFWMKDMNFPLDIIWLDNTLTVTGIEKNLATSTYNTTNPKKSETFGEQYPAEYVLEVPAGYSDENNLKVGEKLFFSEK
jgi:uncharacterized membrane protein (UPF0127 family)